MEEWVREARIVDFDDLGRFGRIARKEGLSFKRTQDTVWFGLYFDDELAGCGGLIWGDKAHTWARLKSALILPEWRRQHGYKPLVFARVDYAFGQQADHVETISRHPQMFLHWGWEVVEGHTKLLRFDRPLDA